MEYHEKVLCHKIPCDSYVLCYSCSRTLVCHKISPETRNEHRNGPLSQNAGNLKKPVIYYVSCEITGKL